MVIIKQISLYMGHGKSCCSKKFETTLDSCECISTMTNCMDKKVGSENIAELFSDK